jgi:hypothetical protein
MKSIAKFLAVLIIGQTLFTAAAQAATAPASIAPLNSYIYTEVNTSKDHPLKGQLADLLKSAAADAPNKAVLEQIAGNIENTTIGISQSFHQTDGSEIYTLSMSLSADSFQTIIDSLGTDLVRKNIGQNNLIYKSGKDFFFTYKDGNLLAANKEGVISDLLLQSSTSSLQQNADWQFLQSKSNPDSFLKMFINFENLPDQAVTEGVPNNMTDFLKSEGLSLLQTANGFTGLVTVKSGPLLGLNPAVYSFVPELYKKINSQNILFYNESFDLADNLKDTLTLLSELPVDSAQEFSVTDIYNEISKSILDTTGLNPDTEIAPLFRNRTAFAVQANPDLQNMPGFTLISEVSGQVTLAQDSLYKLRTKLQSAMKESFNSNYDQELAYRQELINFYKDDPTYKPVALPSREDLEKRFFYTSAATVDGISYDQLHIDLNAQMYFYDDNYVSEPKNMITLSTAVNNGQMIITTMADPGKIFSYSTTLSSDSEWQKSFMNEQSMGITFLNFINLSSYIQSMALANGATSDDIKPVTEFLSPLKSFFSSNRYENGYYIGTVKLNIDLSQISKMESLFSQISQTFSAGSIDRSIPSLDVLDPGLFLTFGFSDVPENAWYARYVNQLANLGIMKGYDSEFRPNQNITRAEYVKTLLAAYETTGNSSNDYQPDKFFSDVDYGAWYFTYVNHAKALGIVNGYSDNTFRPDQPITRAEAMVMLANLRDLGNQDYLSYLKDMPFTDVSPSDWFYQSVRKAFSLKYVNGKTLNNFAPYDKLTRAETAAIISRYLENN